MSILKNVALFVAFSGALLTVSCSSRQDIVDAHLSQIVWQADFLHSITGTFPQTWNEMKVLDDDGEVGMGFAEPVRDPWGNPYVYQVINGKPVAICYGMDAKRGGDGEDQDVGLTLKEPGTNRNRQSPQFKPGKQVAFDFSG